MPRSIAAWRSQQQASLLIRQNAVMTGPVERLLANVGPRLRALRQQRDMTLTDIAATTGISVSTLSRLEAGQRRPSLELLLPIAQTYGLPVDELIGPPAVGDPRVQALPFTRDGITYVPLTRRSGGLQAFKMIIPSTRAP